jgi:hypothetical protein
MLQKETDLNINYSIWDTHWLVSEKKNDSVKRIQDTDTGYSITYNPTK